MLSAWTDSNTEGNYEMAQPVSTMSDHELVVEMMVEDLMQAHESDQTRITQLADEVNRRFGPDATERTAAKAVAWLMTSQEIVLWAACHWDDCRAWLTGEITLDNASEHYGWPSK